MKYILLKLINKKNSLKDPKELLFINKKIFNLEEKLKEISKNYNIESHKNILLILSEQEKKNKKIKPKSYLVNSYFNIIYKIIFLIKNFLI